MKRLVKLFFIVYFIILFCCCDIFDKGGDNTPNYDDSNSNINKNTSIEKCESVYGDIYITVLCSNFSFDILKPKDGIDGSNGSSCSVKRLEYGVEISCNNSSSVVFDGTNGSSCTVNYNVGGSLLSCTDGSEITIYNGKDGINGSDGSDSIIKIIDPCGSLLNDYNEIILRLNGGELLAYFENGNSRFLSILTPGNFVTTDNQKCYFTVTEDMKICYKEKEENICE